VFAWFGAYHFGWKSYETGVGGRERIELADGSTVDLNTNTELNARISDSRREIMLARGEALFHVAHDAKRPFYVVAAGTVVRAVGTAFSVRIRDPEHVDVLVAEGRVAVGAPGTEANFENPTLLDRARMVSAGEAATVRPNSPILVRALPSQDVTRKLAWIAGHLDFQGETLDDAVQEFNRYNQRQITIADPSIVNMRIGGIFSTTDLQSFSDALQKFGIRAQVGDNNGDIRLFAGGKPP
jgi:transmembrane sensor